jgi:peptidyl-prolyl cis-trans isomerase SurA|tara:strand:+ start:3960 stop:5357 length:1398 start_codon:yes stop_codon:yes gene_type:complete
MMPSVPEMDREARFCVPENCLAIARRVICTVPVILWRARAVVVAALLVFVTTIAQGESIDRVVAVVNQGVITESELQREVQRAQLEIRASDQKGPSQTDLRRNLLESMIRDRIQLQLAGHRNIRVNDNLVNSAISDIAEKNRLSLEQLRDEVERGGMAYQDYFEDLREQLTIRRLIDVEVVQKVSVSEQEIDQYLALNPDSWAPGELELELSHLLLSVSGSASDQEIDSQHARAVDIRGEILAGLSFSEAATQYSDSPDAERGGNLGWRKKSELPSLFVQAVKGLLPGQLSEVSRSPNGFHIIQLMARRGGEEMLVEQIRVRHILLVPSVVADESQIRKRLERVRQRIEVGEQFSEMARLHSEDRHSRAKGGDLGWLNPGDATPEFEKVLQKLDVGQLSDVFQTRSGFHLAKLVDRRTRNLSEQMRRSDARFRVRAKKIQENYNQWIRELRDLAFVEIRVPLDEL